MAFTEPHWRAERPVQTRHPGTASCGPAPQAPHRRAQETIQRLDPAGRILAPHGAASHLLSTVPAPRARPPRSSCEADA
jgi:hypothetical protein